MAEPTVHDAVSLPTPSDRAVLLERALGRSLRPLSDSMQVRGLHLHATRAGSAALGSGRLPAGTGTWRVRYGDLPGRWYRARVASARTGAVLYLHGGGFVWGSPRSHRALASWLSHHARMPVFLPHYRRAPEHPYPAAADDALAAYLALLDRGMAPAQITVAGDSAGGHLVATLLRTLAQHGLPFPAAAALFSPFLDLTCAGMRARDLQNRDPFVSPAYALTAATAYAGQLALDDPQLDVIGADKSGWPRVLIQSGRTECMLPDVELLAQSFADAGVGCELQVWPGQVHVFQAFAGVLRDGRRALNYAGRFLRDHVESERTTA